MVCTQPWQMLDIDLQKAKITISILRSSALQQMVWRTKSSIFSISPSNPALTCPTHVMHNLDKLFSSLERNTWMQDISSNILRSDNLFIFEMAFKILLTSVNGVRKRFHLSQKFFHPGTQR